MEPEARRQPGPLQRRLPHPSPERSPTHGCPIRVVNTSPSRPAGKCRRWNASSSAANPGTVRRPAFDFGYGLNVTRPETSTATRTTLTVPVARSSASHRRPAHSPYRRPVPPDRATSARHRSGTAGSGLRTISSRSRAPASPARGGRSARLAGGAGAPSSPGRLPPLEAEPPNSSHSPGMTAKRSEDAIRGHAPSTLAPVEDPPPAASRPCACGFRPGGAPGERSHRHTRTRREDSPPVRRSPRQTGASREQPRCRRGTAQAGRNITAQGRGS